MFHYGDASFCNGGAGGSRNWNPFRKKFPLQVEGRNLLQILHNEYAECLPWLSYVKVDAEGFDRQILESILPILRERQPVVRTEVFKRLSTGERQALFDLLGLGGVRTPPLRRRRQSGWAGARSEQDERRAPLRRGCAAEETGALGGGLRIYHEDEHGEHGRR